MRSLLRAAIAALVCVAGASCTANYPTQPTKPRPLALVIQLSIPKGKVVPGTAATSQYAFAAFTIDSDNVFETVTSKATWLSSDTGVAQLRSGTPSTFFAVAPGEANAIVRYEGLEATAPMLVVGPQARLLPRIEVSASAPKLGGAVGRATAMLHRTTQTVSEEITNVTTRSQWSSDDPGIATVDQAGVITAVGMGTTIITANMDGMTDWVWVSVAPPQ